MTRRLLLPVVALMLGFAAAPAHATLLVRSDGAGLFIQDKNGIKDNADMFSKTLNGQPAYEIRNLNDLDVFKFDRRNGCQETNSFTVTCERNGSAINVLLAGGGDTFNMGGAPVGVASVAGGFGSDHIIGHTGRDNLHGQLGDDDLTGAGGNDDLEGDEEDDKLDGGGRQRRPRWRHGHGQARREPRAPTSSREATATTRSARVSPRGSPRSRTSSPAAPAPTSRRWT